METRYKLSYRDPLSLYTSPTVITTFEWRGQNFAHKDRRLSNVLTECSKVPKISNPKTGKCTLALTEDWLLSYE